EVALDRRRSQKLLDPFRFRESLVDSETNLRSKFQVNVPRDFAAQKFLVALERGQYRLRVAAAERHDVDGGEPQIGAHAHLRYGDHMALDNRIMHLAADEHLGERMADELADAQLSLRSAGGMIAMLMTCQWSSWACF